MIAFATNRVSIYFVLGSGAFGPGCGTDGGFWSNWSVALTSDGGIVLRRNLDKASMDGMADDRSTGLYEVFSGSPNQTFGLSGNSVF